MRFPLSSLFLLLAATSLAPVASAQPVTSAQPAAEAAATPPPTPSDVFERAKRSWDRSCASATRGLCVRRKVVATTRSCSGNRHTVRRLRRVRKRVAAARADFGRAIELATVVIDSKTTTEAERAAAERARTGSMFFLAEAEVERLLARPQMPRLDFDPDRPRQTRRNTKRFTTWLESTRKDVEATEALYREVIAQKGDGVAFRVAAAARTAEILTWWADALGDATVPPVVRNAKTYRDDLRRAYCDAIDDQAGPLRARAKLARAYCADLARKTRMTVAVAAACKAPHTGAGRSATKAAVQAPERP